MFNHRLTAHIDLRRALSVASANRAIIRERGHRNIPLLGRQTERRFFVARVRKKRNPWTERRITDNKRCTVKIREASLERFILTSQRGGKANRARRHRCLLVHFLCFSSHRVVLIKIMRLFFNFIYLSRGNCDPLRGASGLKGLILPSKRKKAA